MRSDVLCRFGEATYLSFDVQASIDNNLNRLAVSGQGTSVADKDEKTIQVLGEATESGDSYHYEAHFKLDQEGISPKPMVYTVYPGQYLPCGIGVQAHCNARYDLSPSDVRRWELAASAILEIIKSCPRGVYNLAYTRKIECLFDFLDKHHFRDTFVEYIPDFTKDTLDYFDEDFQEEDSVLKETWALFLYLLRFFIPLNAAYGGIHLTAWNFEFPSRIESIIWRIACFIIMGSSFAMLAAPIVEKSRDTIKRFEGALSFSAFFEKITNYGFFWPLFLCYAAARFYLVVESFISLRHVPIGVYAAVPWVQNIPHV